MTDLLSSLIGGAALIALANWLLGRFTRLGPHLAGAVVALATLGIYVPWAILDWPGGDLFAIHVAIYLVVSAIFALVGGARPALAGAARFPLGPSVIVGFFVLLVAADSVFVTLAERGLSSPLARLLLPPTAEDARVVNSGFPGVMSHDFQKKEELYNRYLEQVERQRARGWQVQKGWVSDPHAGEAARLQIAVTDRDGRPLRGALVRGEFLRPADSRLDLDFEMDEVDAGVYRAAVTLPAPGTWNLVLEIRKGEDLHEVRASTRVRAGGGGS